MSNLAHGFHTSHEDQPHRQRTKEIIAKHPEIANLMGRTKWSAVAIVGQLAVQVTAAILLRHQPIWLILIVAYTVGAMMNHNMFIMLHEAAHNLIFKQKRLNRVFGIMGDVVNVIPTAISFKVYHLKHHSHQGDYDHDADMASHWEAKLIGNNPIMKALWLLVFPIMQMTRPPRLKAIRFANVWTVINWVTVFAFDAVMLYFFGWKALLYLGLSLFFAIGLHPLGARWIQEHYTVFPPQETYSYYGPLNRFAFNIGYHNEHHDFPAVPWINLPKIKEYAPEYYENLVYHTSYTKLLFKFIFDPKIDLYSRVIRDNKHIGSKKAAA